MTARRSTSEPESLAEACESGDLRRSLEALRRNLADAIAVCPVDKVAPLTARLESVLVRLAELESPEVSALDELRMARDKRRTSAVRSRSPKQAKRGG
jgi:hypothetical protein